MSQRPHTLYGTDASPIGLVSWRFGHDARSYELIARVLHGQQEGLTQDDIRDNVRLDCRIRGLGVSPEAAA